MNTETKDTITIRKGEELPLESLAQYLRAHLPEVLQQPASLFEGSIEVRQFPSGHSNLTYLVRLNDREYVLRRPPFGPVAPTAHDMPREYRLLSAVNQHFSLAPRPYLLCEDKEVIGAAFYLMERRNGHIIQRAVPPELGSDPDLRRRISESLIDTLAQLHSVDIYQTGLVTIGKPAGFVSRQVKGWSERWQRAKTSEVPEIDQVIDWLNRNMPIEQPNAATMVHNDFKLDNVMLSFDNPAEITAVLDWEMSTVGDPLIDLGIFLGYWAQPDDPPTRREMINPVTAEAGWLTRAQLIERYQAKSGRDLSNISFYETFALFKLSVVLQQIYFRFVNGQTKDQRFSVFDQYVKGLAIAAVELAK